MIERNAEHARNMHTRCKARTEHAKVGWRANHDDDDIRFEATTADG